MLSVLGRTVEAWSPQCLFEACEDGNTRLIEAPTRLVLETDHAAPLRLLLAPQGLTEHVGETDACPDLERR
jgi:hypothetical protein